ncbi:MAG TPA: hypothetical protein VFS15_12500 [Kofleriaceae bacterium]|nr:hypothetical protein [Kofleriaceae bacterium]
MVRTRSLLIAALALGLGAGACKKKEDTKSDQAAEKGGENAVTKPAGGGAAVAGADDLSLLPADSDVVLGLNFSQLQQSALWKQFAPKLMEKAAGDLAEFKAMCGFDPMEKFKSMSLGIKGADAGKTPDGAVVIHGPDKATVMGCLSGKGKEELAKKGTEVTIDGDVVVMKKDGETTAWTFVNNDTALGVIGANASKDTLLAAAKGGSALKTSPAFVDIYSKVNVKDSLWFLVNGNAPFMAKAALPGGKPKAVFGSVNVTDGLTLDLHVRMATPDEAKSLVTMMQGQTNNPQVKQMFDKLEVSADGTDAKVAVALSNQKLQQLVGMVGGMMGGMMGGGMGGP